MSYEDSFEREAADERAYLRFESWYVYEKLRPQSTGRWEWLLMFDRAPSYFTYAEAARDAREMAREMGKSVEVRSLYEGCFVARPQDYHNFPQGSYWTTYASKRADFIKALVVEGKYPDLVQIARDLHHPDSGGISRHYCNDIGEKHRLWKEAAKSGA